MSDTGIEELAADEEFLRSALLSAYGLQIKISASIFYLIVSYMYYRVVPESLIFTLIGFFALTIYYIFLILQWQYKYKNIPMWNKTAQTAHKAKNIAAITFLAELTLIVLYLYINW